jgi:Holliday junction DNA helicase RuvA
MIEKISGKIIEKSPTFCVVDFWGLGIGLHISLNTFQHLENASGKASVELFSYLHVREDALQLYGFFEAAEKEFFQLLISISGIGPKLAIAILSGCTTDELRSAIVQEDIDRLIRIPGVGRKTAQRLVLELKEKIQKQSELKQLAAIPEITPQHQPAASEALLALVSLGYKQHDAQRAINKVMRQSGGELSIEDVIKQALKEF